MNLCFALFCLIVLLPKSLSKLFHNRCKPMHQSFETPAPPTPLRALAGDWRGFHLRYTPCWFPSRRGIGPLQDPATWYGINCTGTQITQWDYQSIGKSRWTGKSSCVLKVPLRHLRPSVIYSVPCDLILQRAYLLEVKVFASPTRRISGTVTARVLFLF